MTKVVEPTMTPENAAALRKPFAAESIGKLPKPLKGQDQDRGKCERGSRYSADGFYCGGYHARALHLDFAGHAAVTDRLLSVDPAWSWEPVAYDEAGLPAFDKRGNLWIRLTICGVTRLGVGDGTSIKEVIGDAIRNAAIRFGVALDLWAKENLVEFRQVAEGLEASSSVSPAAPTPNPAASGEDLDPAVEGITDQQRKRMHALLSDLGLSDRDKYLKLACWQTNRELASTSDMTNHEASGFIDYLAGRVADMKKEARA